MLESVSLQKNRLRSAKNVIFFLLCILVDRPMGGGGLNPQPPCVRPWGYLLVFVEYRFNRIPQMGTKHFKNHISILAIAVNYRDWQLDASLPLQILSVIAIIRRVDHRLF